MNFDPRNTIFLIDGSSFLYRAYYGLRPLHTKDGIPVQAVYGFCRMIKKIIDTFHPQHVALVWDSKGKTERHEIFPEYKATRQAAPSDIFDQKEYIVQFADLIGMKQVAQTGIEADDILYSIARDWNEQGGTALLATLDKDMGQALTDKTYLFDPFKYEIIDQQTFEKRKGISVAQLPFYYSLIGDTSDNIPGVRGIGPKTALELLSQFTSLDDLYARIEQVPRAAIRNALLTHKDNAYLSYKLFLLRYIPLHISAQEFAFDEAQWSNARSLFEQLNFKSLLTDDTKTSQNVVQSIEQKIEYWKSCNFVAVTTVPQLQELVARITQAQVCAIDTETNGLRPLEVSLVGISCAVDESSAYYIPCGTSGLSIEVVINHMKPVLENRSIKKYMHHAKFDQLVLSNYGIEVQGLVFDTMVGAHLVLQDWQRPGLKDLSEFYFKESMLSYAEVVKQQKYKDFSQVPLELATFYAAADARQTYKLAQVVYEQLAKEPELLALYESVEHPLIQTLYHMEKHGIPCDASVLRTLNTQVTQALERIELDIRTFLPEGMVINLNSPRQIEQLLFEQLQLPPQKKSAKGTRYSTDAEVLAALAHMHPVPALIITYRELTKLKTTYIEALPEYINLHTGNIHTTFSQTSVATGRLASSEPNLQNIPADSSSFGLEIRAAFKAPQGRVFISADYSQIELRVLAHLSGDERLVTAFLQGHDIHAQTASHLFDVAVSDVTHEQRQVGKRINFSILYGLTPYGLSKDLKIPFKDAKRYIDTYFSRYPAVSAWMEQIIAFAKEHGYVKTVWGRRRYIPTIHEKNQSLYQEACRIAINTVAQGTAAEIMKKGMIELERAVAQHRLDVQLLLQIHDELIVSVPHEQSVRAEQLLKSVLESVVIWSVPLQVMTRIGIDWKEITK